MYSKNKSKVLQTLEETVPPVNDDDAVEMIAQIVRQPKNNPIEMGLRLGKIDKDHDIMHLESQMKLHEAMEHFDASAEQLDKVMPVSNEELNELVDLSTTLYEVDEADEDLEEEEEDEEDDNDSGLDDDTKNNTADDNSSTIGNVLRRYNLSNMFFWRRDLSECYLATFPLIPLLFEFKICWN